MYFAHLVFPPSALGRALVSCMILNLTMQSHHCALEDVTRAREVPIDILSHRINVLSRTFVRPVFSTSTRGQTHRRFNYIVRTVDPLSHLLENLQIITKTSVKVKDVRLGYFFKSVERYSDILYFVRRTHTQSSEYSLRVICISICTAKGFHFYRATRI